MRIVLAHSGGFPTSIAISWLAGHAGAEVITVTMDLGQRSELVDIRERALGLGALRGHVIDVREQFVREYIRPSLQAGVLYEDRSPMPTELGRALIAKMLIDVARMEGATTIAHGCAPGSSDHVRFETAARALDRSLTVIPTAQLLGMSGSEELQYAQQRNIPVPPLDAAHVTHANLWGRSIECTKPDDLWIEPPPGIYALTRPPQDCPGQPAYIEIEFERGVPVRANGIEMTLLEMIESLETIAGTHGVGRIDVIEQRVTGRPSRKLYEAPAAVVLHAAHRELEKLVIPRDLERLTHTLGRTYADLVYGGEWFSQTREAIDGFTAAIQPRVTGSVRLKLFKGDCQVVGRRSPFAPDDGDTSTLKVGETHDRAAAEGIQER